MAAVNVLAANKTKIDAGGSGQNVIDSGLYGGVKKVCIDTYTLKAVEANSTIKIATPPKGSKIIGCRIVTAALGTGVTLALGDTVSGQSARYLAASSAATAANISAIKVGAIGYVIGTTDGDEKMIVTVGGATATGAIATIIEYV